MMFASAQAYSPTDLYSPVPVCLLPQQRFDVLSVIVDKDTTEAIFYARDDSLVTSRFPGFEKKLLKILPNLLTNVKCFNGHNHHFATEMLATETGHLFEHIWLEVLCCEKLQVAKSAHYSGETSWNWREEPRGLFHITLQAGAVDRELIEYSARISKRILSEVLG